MRDRRRQIHLLNVQRRSAHASTSASIDGADEVGIGHVSSSTAWCGVSADRDERRHFADAAIDAAISTVAAIGSAAITASRSAAGVPNGTHGDAPINSGA